MRQFKPTRDGYRELAKQCYLYNEGDPENGTVLANVLEDRDYIRMEQTFEKSLGAE